MGLPDSRRKAKYHKAVCKRRIGIYAWIRRYLGNIRYVPVPIKADRFRGKRF